MLIPVRLCKLTRTFLRQVNGWGFKRIMAGKDHNSYYHELFVRDQPQACLQMKRIRKGRNSSESKKLTNEEANRESSPTTNTIGDEQYVVPQSTMESRADLVQPANVCATRRAALETPSSPLTNLPGVDPATLFKLQEALRAAHGSTSLAALSAAPVPTPKMPNLSSLASQLEGPNGSVLAAQLQAATRAATSPDN